MQLRCNEHVDEEDADAALTLLLPLCRSLATNWKVGNRREAGVALAHITGSGSEASQVVTALSRLLKKVVRFMLCWHYVLIQPFAPNTIISSIAIINK